MHEIPQNYYMTDLRWQSSAIMALQVRVCRLSTLPAVSHALLLPSCVSQEAAEAYLVGLFEDTNRARAALLRFSLSHTFIVDSSSVRYSRQTRDHHAQGHAACAPHPRGASLSVGGSPHFCWHGFLQPILQTAGRWDKSPRWPE